jgi:hypothetical protein
VWRVEPLEPKWLTSRNGNPYFNTKDFNVVIFQQSIYWYGRVTHHRSGQYQVVGDRLRTEAQAKQAAIDVLREMEAAMAKLGLPPALDLRAIAAASATGAELELSYSELEDYELAKYCTPACHCRNMRWRLGILECANHSLQLRLQCTTCKRLCRSTVSHDLVEADWITPGIARSNV